MANKRICDRCGKDVGLKTINLIVFFGPDFLDVDLCEDCEKELHKWLENKGCKCNKNENVVELLDLIESHEKEICKQSSKIEQLEKENEMLKNGTVKELLESMDIEISVSVKKKNE